MEKRNKRAKKVLALVLSSAMMFTPVFASAPDVKAAENTPDTATGAEYDFSAASHSGDFADPGKKKAGYDLIWADEFDGKYGSDKVDKNTGLNLSNWAYQLGDGTTDCNNPGWGNQELECYTADRKNIAVNEDLNNDGRGDGCLRITASYEKDGYTYKQESAKKYTSARIRTTKATKGLFNMTYGYVEARMSLPATKGAWPAFWMLPQSTDIYGGWPVSGEIDIMETCGAFADGSNGKTCSTLHWGCPEHVYRGSGYTDLSSDYTNFHTYAVDWKPGKITFYYDGAAIYTSENWTSGFAGASDALSFDAPFDQPFYMLLNLAVDSGQFGGEANKAGFEGNINMYVDYVRAYQKSNGYSKSVTRKASGNANTDWMDYAGKNQIADLTVSNVKEPMETNGGMNDKEADMANWYLSYQSDASDAVIAAEQKDGKDWAKIGITSKGANDYSVQMIGHYNARAGYTYKVSFDAYADGQMVGKTVNCDSKEWAGWSTYGILSFNLKDKPESYSYLFSQADDFERCRIEFNMGAQDSGNVYIGNVRVEIVDPAMIAQESKTRQPLANGDIIYNGTFDQGNNHTGYWKAGKGTKLSVPRYTTKKLAATDKSVIDIASKINKNSRIHVKNGVKYYERRAQISAPSKVKPNIYQTGLNMPKDTYTLKFDMYSKKASTVTATICSGKTGKKIISKKLSYKTKGKVKTLKWNFKLAKTVENATLRLTFADGSSVQIDNVSLIGKSLGVKVDKTPMNSKTTWTADGCELDAADAVKTASQITSGEAWYAPQLISSNFSLSAGQSYKLSFKYKMSGVSNQTGEYIIQENGGSWTVYGDGPTKFTYDKKKADKDGFCSYSVVIPATVSLDTVHMVFGFGNSEANQAQFVFKDVKMTLYKN